MFSGTGPGYEGRTNLNATPEEEEVIKGEYADLVSAGRGLTFDISNLAIRELLIRGGVRFAPTFVINPKEATRWNDTPKQEESDRGLPRQLWKAGRSPKSCKHQFKVLNSKYTENHKHHKSDIRSFVGREELPPRCTRRPETRHRFSVPTSWPLPQERGADGHQFTRRN